MYKYKKVIILDDNEIERFIVDVVIKKCAFAETTLSFEYGGDVLEYLQSIVDEPAEYPDMIFLDIAMPRMNGFEFLIRFEALPEKLKQKCPIVILSSTIDISDTDSVKAFPFVKSFIIKPIKADMLDGL